ncbi:hypothetical protein K402DRAFT_251118 [Aulographum hederae CBS 113979]|uniref:Uncharacterized protein n=1 Tax=Aulographum hederae CBS 113979 TaxID=1176131 RepID=A0A6G1GK71_9PEZI|nr:hypothetical protein K402DRAFT_251118 [Aulographum hederae CBS 113979]
MRMDPEYYRVYVALRPDEFLPPDAAGSTAQIDPISRLISYPYYAKLLTPKQKLIKKKTLEIFYTGLRRRWTQEKGKKGFPKDATLTKWIWASQHFCLQTKISSIILKPSSSTTLSPIFKRVHQRGGVAETRQSLHLSTRFSKTSEHSPQPTYTPRPTNPILSTLTAAIRHFQVLVESNTFPKFQVSAPSTWGCKHA